MKTSALDLALMSLARRCKQCQPRHRRHSAIYGNQQVICVKCLRVIRALTDLQLLNHYVQWFKLVPTSKFGAPHCTVKPQEAPF